MTGAIAAFRAGEHPHIVQKQRHRGRIALGDGRAQAGGVQGLAKFFTFLSSPDLQAWYHQASGYLPIIHAAYELTKQQGLYEKPPGPTSPPTSPSAT